MSLTEAKHVELRVAEFSRPEVESVKALNRGDAAPDQQRRALAAIVNKISRTHDIHYVPGDPQASAFIAGRGFVGAQILKILNLPVGALTNEKGENGD